MLFRSTMTFKSSRFEGGGMRYLRFNGWLEEIARVAGPFHRIVFEEVRRHVGTDAAHVFGGLLATLTAWAEMHSIPYEGVRQRLKRAITLGGKSGGSPL